MRLEFLEDGDLPHGSGWDALIFVLEFDFFEGDNFLGVSVSSLENDSISALPDRFNSLIVVHIQFTTDLNLNYN